MGQREEAFGTVVFVKPGRMRWEFQAPQRQSIVADGTTLWIYQPDERQVLKGSFNAAFVSTTPVSFLAGVGRIKDDFDVAQDGGDQNLVVHDENPLRRDRDGSRHRRLPGNRHDPGEAGGAKSALSDARGRDASEVGVTERGCQCLKIVLPPWRSR